MWSAIFSAWLVQCESLNTVIEDRSTAILQRWYSVIGQWASIKQGVLPPEVTTTTQKAIAQFLRVRSALELEPPKAPARYHYLGVMQPRNARGQSVRGCMQIPQSPV